MNNFKKLQLTTKNEREKNQKQFIINNIDKIINDILKNDKQFKTSDIDISINNDLFDLQ